MSQRPLISLIHPTARTKPYPPSLPFGWTHTADAFFKAAAHPERIEYVLSVHESRWEEFWGGLLRERRKALWPKLQRVQVAQNDIGQASCLMPGFGSIRIVKHGGPDTNVANLNNAAAHSSGEIIIGTMDDLFPPLEWDMQILEGLKPTLLRALAGEALLHFSTASPRDQELIVGAALTRKRYERYGYILHPSYESMFADHEFTDVARRDGVVVERLDIKFCHRHPSWGASVADDIHALQNRPEAYRVGEANYLIRKTCGFPVKCASKSIAVCLPGETFCSDYLVMWTNLFGHLLTRRQPYAFSPVAPHFAHTTNVYVTRAELLESVLTVKPLPDYVLWIDDDNLLTPPQFEMLLAGLEAHPEAAGVAAWCWVYNHNVNKWFVSCGHSGPDMQCFPIDPLRLAGQELIPIDWSGFPAILMRRSALEAIGKRPFTPIIKDELQFGFSGEDTAFFHRAKEAGLKFLVDPRVKVPHIKMWAMEPPIPGRKDDTPIKSTLKKLGVLLSAG